MTGVQTCALPIFSDDGLVPVGRVPSGFLYVDGIVGDVGQGVLRDRKVLAEEGVVVVVVTVNISTGKVLTGPEIITRGWVYAPEAEDLLDEACDTVADAVERALASGRPSCVNVMIEGIAEYLFNRLTEVDEWKFRAGESGGQVHVRVAREPTGGLALSVESPSQGFGHPDAEVVIEDYIQPRHVRDEGPFGEYPWYYTGLGDRPVITVTGITMRKDAIWQDINAAHPEHNSLGMIPKAGSIWRNVRDAVPHAVKINLPMSGCARLHCYISLTKRADGEPKQAAFAAFAAEANLGLIILVDDDIDQIGRAHV